MSFHLISHLLERYTAELAQAAVDAGHAAKVSRYQSGSCMGMGTRRWTVSLTTAMSKPDDRPTIRGEERMRHLLLDCLWFENECVSDFRYRGCPSDCDWYLRHTRVKIRSRNLLLDLSAYVQGWLTTDCLPELFSTSRLLAVAPLAVAEDLQPKSCWRRTTAGK